MERAGPAPLLQANALKELIQYDELTLSQITYPDIRPLVEDLATSTAIKHAKIGCSHLGLPIHMFSFGHGPMKVLAWSQMHGDESTATAALFDIMKQFSMMSRYDFKTWSKHLTLHFVPMLNPDGANENTRENAQGLDINRDAIKLATPEGKILSTLLHKIKPTYALNLHDQNDFHRCEGTLLPATISLLAPPYDSERSINSSRKKAMVLSAFMAESMSDYIPNQISRYDDTYGKDCFGDYCSALNISTILIESGPFQNDDKRQVARAMNIMGMLELFNLLTTNWHRNESFCDTMLERYTLLPKNIDIGNVET